MAREWNWGIRHTLDNKIYSPGDRGKIASSTIRNSGKVAIHIYDFGIQFGWQEEKEIWWNEKCNIFLNPEEEIELPLVGFKIPLDIEPKTYEYKIGVRTESAQKDSKWLDHGLVWGELKLKVVIKKHEDRNYSVFISHSNHETDKKLLNTLSTLLSNNGIRYYIAEEVPKYGEFLWKKIRSLIIASDRVIFLWTKNATESGDVREELGITIGSRKKFIPIIEKGADQKGSLIGTEYESFDRKDFEKTIAKVTEELIKFAEEKAKRTKKVKPEEALSP